MPELMKTGEVTAALGIARQTLYVWVEKGYLTPVAMPGQLRFRRSDVEALLQPRISA